MISSPVEPSATALGGKLYALLGQHPSVTIDSAARLLSVTARHTATILSRLRRYKLLIVHRDGWARSKQDLRNQTALQLNVLRTLFGSGGAVPGRTGSVGVVASRTVHDACSPEESAEAPARVKPPFV